MGFLLRKRDGDACCFLFRQKVTKEPKEFRLFVREQEWDACCFLVRQKITKDRNKGKGQIIPSPY